MESKAQSDSLNMYMQRNLRQISLQCPPGDRGKMDTGVCLAYFVRIYLLPPLTLSLGGVVMGGRGVI